MPEPTVIRAPIACPSCGEQVTPTNPLALCRNCRDECCEACLHGGLCDVCEAAEIDAMPEEMP